MIPKPLLERLSNSMQFTNSIWQTRPPGRELAGLGFKPKESKLKLSLETRYRGDVLIVHCQGRWAQSRNADLKWASPSPLVRELLDLTHVDSVLEIHPSLTEALDAFQRGEVCADC